MSMKVIVVGGFFSMLLLLLLHHGAAAFAPTRWRMMPLPQSSTCCWAAAKANTRKGSKKTTTSNSSSGTGFGTSSRSNKQKMSSSSKLRSGLSNSKLLRKAANTFDAIRKEYDITAACNNDVYIRSPLHSPTTFWFVGKVAAVPGQATGRDACLVQKRIILEYAQTQLRPQNMGGKYAPHLELWLAPADSEMDVVTNKVSLEKVVGNNNTGSAAATTTTTTDLPVVVSSQDFNIRNVVGYNPEIYVGDEVTKGGLRVERDEEGRPIKPVFEVNESV